MKEVLAPTSSAVVTSHWCSQVFSFCGNKKAVMYNSLFYAYHYKKLFKITSLRDFYFFFFFLFCCGSPSS